MIAPEARFAAHYLVLLLLLWGVKIFRKNLSEQYHVLILHFQGRKKLKIRSRSYKLSHGDTTTREIQLDATDADASSESSRYATQASDWLFSISSYVIGWAKTRKSRWRQLSTGFHINSRQVCFRFKVIASRLLLQAALSRCLPAYESKPDCCVGIAMNIYPGQLFGNIVGLITMWTKNVGWPKMVLSIWNMRQRNQKIMSSLKLCGHLILLVMRIFTVCRVCREVFIDRYRLMESRK